MNIIIKPRAAEELGKVEVPAGTAIRIDASLEGGGCGCNIMYSLQVDAPAADDTIIRTENGLTVVASPATLEWVGDEVSLGYLDNVGYTLANDEQTLTYGLKLNLRA